jgi:hypothetical protein
MNRILDTQNPFHTLRRRLRMRSGPDIPGLDPQLPPPLPGLQTSESGFRRFISPLNHQAVYPIMTEPPRSPLLKCLMQPIFLVFHPSVMSAAPDKPQIHVYTIISRTKEININPTRKAKKTSIPTSKTRRKNTRAMIAIHIHCLYIPSKQIFK